MDKRIFRLAFPNIISNITVPLLGMIDIAIAGHLGSVIYIGAIALASNVFNMIYWNFGFLRMSTSGFTAQAYGARNFGEAMNVLLRSLIVAIGFGLLILLLQVPIEKIAINFIKSGPETIENVKYYFRICVWSAPMVLGVYAFNGWFIGMQNAKTPMVIAIINNVLNIALSFIFVFGFDMKIKGIALGTMLSQIITFAITMAFWFRYYGRLNKYINISSIFNIEDRRPSHEKTRADYSCRMMMENEGGHGYKIIGYCRNFFTVAWIAGNALRIETASNSFVIPEVAE